MENYLIKKSSPPVCAPVNLAIFRRKKQINYLKIIWVFGICKFSEDKGEDGRVPLYSAFEELIGEVYWHAGWNKKNFSFRTQFFKNVILACHIWKICNMNSVFKMFDKDRHNPIFVIELLFWMLAKFMLWPWMVSTTLFNLNNSSSSGNSRNWLQKIEEKKPYFSIK